MSYACSSLSLAGIVAEGDIGEEGEGGAALGTDPSSVSTNVKEA